MMTLANLSLGPLFGEIRMNQLAYFAHHPEHPMMQQVEIPCHGRPDPANETIRIACPTGATVRCARYFSEVSACQDCRDKWEETQGAQRLTKHWEKICPKGYRDTDRTHAGFPKAQWEALTNPERWNGQQSLFFHGPTGKGKSRLAFLMLWRAMVANRWVGVLWPEKLRSLGQGFDSTTFDHYAAFDVLLMDDPLLTACRESKLVDSVKMLIDVRMREKRATILTSQIGTEEEITQGKEFGDAKVADKERIAAILRRLKESCRVISFVTAAPTDNAVAF